MKNLILAILFLSNFALAATKVPLGSGVSGVLKIVNGGTTIVAQYIKLVAYEL